LSPRSAALILAPVSRGRHPFGIRGKKSMAKIKVAKPIVELDGEMARMMQSKLT
jgi:hypothetical protein